jgi:putative ABC transport system permease protein
VPPGRLFLKKGEIGDMPYSLTTLWHDRQRFLPGVLAVAFSSLLIALQCGLLLGLFSITSIPIDHTRADIWMGAPGVLSVDLGETIRGSYEGRLEKFRSHVSQVEPYLQGFAYWAKPEGGRELCMVIGSRLSPDALGAVKELTPDLRAKLSERNAIVIDESDKGRLGITNIGEYAEITGTRVRVVGFTQGLRSLAGPYVFCHIETARNLLKGLAPGQVTYVLAKCKNSEDAPRIVQELRKEYSDVSAFTSSEFSLKSRLHWLFKTKAGVALGYAALLGLLVGAVVTSQTLYAATVASVREFAVLRALGIPRWRIVGMVMSQSIWVGIFGVALGFVAVHAAKAIAATLGASVELPTWLQIAAAAVTMTMAILAGITALRSLRQVEPAMLLR